jgi:PGF-pre-PGF domain-containing protein
LTNKREVEMKKLIFLAIVSLLIITVVADSTLSKQKIMKVDESKEKILLRSREFRPTGKIISAKSVSLVEEGRKHILLQLKKIPNAKERRKLEKKGIKLLSYIPNKAWVASIPADRLTVTAEVENVEGVAELVKEDKISRRVKDGEFGEWAFNPDGTVKIVVQFQKDISLDDAEDTIDYYGGVVNKRVNPLNGLVASISEDKIPELAEEDIVLWIDQIPIPLTPLNDGARAATGVDVVQAAPYNLNGSGIVVNVYDGDLVNDTHPDFGTRVTLGESGSYASHATHVAGTVAGNGTNCQKGMAPAADIVSYMYESCVPYCLYNNSQDIESNYNESIYTYGADLVTNSIGSNVDLNGYDCDWEGDYETTAQLVDGIVRGSLGRPFIVIWAGGNERGYTNCGTSYYSIAPPSPMKNGIVVGATDDSDAMSSFSGWGPVDDGRIKPDIVAPGVSISSTQHGDSLCTIKSGTSMSTPVVAGSTALLLQQHRLLRGNVSMLPSTVKAIWVHTADDLGNTGPDYQFGYGRINVTTAVETVRRHNITNDTRLIVEGFISDQNVSNRYYTVVPAGQSYLKITLAWDDYPGTPLAAKELVNDLDLVVVAPNNTRYYPWILNNNSPSDAATTGVDDTNNIEQVYVANPLNGTWTITVNGTSVPQPAQNYSLVTDYHLTEAPIISFVNPTPDNNVVTINTSVYINITSNEDLSTAFLEWNYTNETMNGSAQNWYKNKTGLSGLYYYKVYGNNSEGTFGVSSTRQARFNTTLVVINSFFPNTSAVNIAEPNNQTFNISYTNSTGDSNISWYQNGSFLSGFENLTEWKFTGNYSSDGTYNITVVVTDDISSASQEWTLTVNNTNRLPTIANVTITPSTAYSNDTLNCTGSYSDPDNEAESGSSWKWFNDTALISVTTQTLNYTYFNKHSNITCEYTSSDGIDNGTPLNSSPRYINNSLPTIEAYDPKDTTPIISEPNNQFFNISYNDPDNDISVFWYQNGSLMNTSNNFTFMGDYSSEGSYNITVEITDGEAIAGQEWTLTVTDNGCTLATNGMNISNNTVLCPLTYNLANGITITSDNVTLDCNNSVLNGTGNNTGVYLSNINNVTINNCKSQNYDKGFAVLYSNYTTFNLNNGSSNTVGFWINNSYNVTLIKNTLTNNTNGLFIKSGNNLTILNNTISFNSYVGIHFYSSNSSILIINNTFVYAGTTYLIINNQSNNLTAEYNYWGSANATEIASKIYDYYDDPSKGIVDYIPWYLGSGYTSDSDNDKDGYANSSLGGLDCNDTNSSINPEATEYVNGVDDDCDTVIDEGFVDGNSSSVASNTFTPNATINYSNNFSQQYNSTLLVQIKNNSEVVVEFQFNFTNATLNLTNVSVNKQSANSSNGAVIVRNLNLTAQNRTKTVYVDKLNGTTTGVCIKDGDVTSLDDISINCTSADEIPLDCDSDGHSNTTNLTTYTCTAVTINNKNLLKVEGLRFSAVKEFAACNDNDGDSHGNGCAAGLDCDDANSNRYYGNTEICGDGIDQNCDNSDPVCPTTSSGGGGGGGGGFGRAPTGLKVAKYFGVIAYDTTASLTANKKGLAFTKNTFTVNKQLTRVTITVERVDNVSLIRVPLLNVYQYFKIDMENMDNSDISTATIEFRVNKSWLKNRNRSTVVLHRYYHNEWFKLPTEEIKETSNHYYFRATTPGFSYFAITAEFLKSAFVTTVENITPELTIEEAGVNETVENVTELNITPVTIEPPKKEGFSLKTKISIALIILLSAVFTSTFIFWREKKLWKELTSMVKRCPKHIPKEHTIIKRKSRFERKMSDIDKRLERLNKRIK